MLSNPNNYEHDYVLLEKHEGVSSNTVQVIKVSKTVHMEHRNSWFTKLFKIAEVLHSANESATDSITQKTSKSEKTSRKSMVP